MAIVASGHELVSFPVTVWDTYPIDERWSLRYTRTVSPLTIWLSSSLNKSDRYVIRSGLVRSSI